MTKSKLKLYLFSCLISLAIAAGFYIDGRNATINNLSSDQWNILPVCIKLDHPELFAGDLFADDKEDIEYYIPFFVSGVRLATRFSNDNYIEGLNKFNFLINLLYTFCWALFFYYIGHNLPLALLMSVAVRGILALPGAELWGAGALWTALPRTAFLALVPLTLIFFLPALKCKYNRFIGALLLGLISNLHPVSGLGLCLSVAGTDFFFQRFINKVQLRSAINQSLIIGFLMIIGLAPYIFTYLTDVALNTPHDPVLFKAMIGMRIGEKFHEPFLVIKQFGHVRLIFLICIPVLLVAMFYKKLPDYLKKVTNFFGILMLTTFTVSLLSVPIEILLRKAGLDLNLSFQLIRNVKYIMISVFVFYLVTFLFFISKIKPNSQRRFSTAMIITFMLILLIARLQPFNQLPVIGDIFFRYTLPNAFSIKEENSHQDSELDSMLAWINTNTEENASFVGPAQVRTACRRSVLFDFKGASMLIEGNPDKFVQWAKRAQCLSECKTLDCEFELYVQWGAKYYLTDKVSEMNDISPLKKIGPWSLYKLVY